MPEYLDDNGNPIQQNTPPPKVYLDPNTGEPSTPAPVDTGDPAKKFRAGVYSNMLDATPSFVYSNMDEVDKQIRERGGDDFDKGIGYAIKTGFEETPLGLILRGQAPEPFESHSMIGNFIHDVSEFVSDPLMLASALAAPEGVGIAGFAADAALRKTLMDQYQKGDVKDFGELADRAAGIVWEGAKGALIAKAGIAASEIPVGSFIEKSALASAGVKGLYQSAVLTTAGSLLNGQLPTAQDFVRTSAVIAPLSLVTGGRFLKGGKETERALQDVYAKTGRTPEESATSQAAQPHDPPDQAPGLRPAVRVGEDFVVGDKGEVHNDIAERTTGEKPVTMDKLEANPELADKVLQNPYFHGQDVIDKAWELKEAELAGTTPIAELYNRGQMKSGRGFVTPDGKFLERAQAKQWVRMNEPEVSQMWEQVAGDKNSEFHSGDYAEARDRVQNRTVIGGTPEMAGVSPENQKILAAAREDLNKIKAGETSTGYGKAVLRTLFVGQRDARVALVSQLRGRLMKLLPDHVDREAMTFLREYRNDPERLQQKIEDWKKGTDEQKKLVPAMERALNPSPEMAQADAQMTNLFKWALDEGRQFGFLDSAIEPERYSPRLFIKMMEDAEKQPKGIARPPMTTKTPHGIQRMYEFIDQALDTGRVEARTLDAVDALSVYGERHAKAVATNLLKLELQNTDLGRMVGREDTVPEGWRELAPASRTLRDLYVPKDVYDALKPILRTDSILDYPILKNIRHSQALVKGMELGFSIFHMKALTITAMNNMSFADFTRALKSDLSSPEFEAAERNWAARGLTTTMTSTPYEAYKGLKPSSVPNRLDVLRGTFPIKQADAVFHALTHATFDVIQRKFKVMDASLKEAAWAAKNPEATDAQYEAAMRGIAKEVNGAYGGLNWEIMGWGKDVREIARALILAPDWTFSNVVNLKYAFTEGGPGGKAARTFWVKSFVTGMALTQAMSIAVSGQMSDKHFEVYLGTDDKGKKMYSNMFFAGAPKDALTWLGRSAKDGAITGTAEFASYKLGPIAGAGLGLIVNKGFDYKPITKKGQGFAEKTAREAAFVAGRTAPIPFNVSEVAKIMFDPEKESTYWDVIGALTAQRVTHEGEKGEKTAKPKEAFHLPGVSRKGFKL